jgi:hypothetical protein
LTDHAAVIDRHAGAIGIEDPHHLDVDIVLPEAVEEQGLGAALALVVAGARADRIDLAPIGFDLGVDLRVAIDLAGRGLQHPSAGALGQVQHVDRAHDIGAHGHDRVVLIMDRRGRAGQVVDLVHRNEDRVVHVVVHELEVRVIQQVGDVVLAAGEQVVQADHAVAARDQPVAQVRADEPGSAGDQDAKSGMCFGGLGGHGRSLRRDLHRDLICVTGLAP